MLKKMETAKPVACFSILLVFLLLSFPLLTCCYDIFQQEELPAGVVGPESLAFDCNGEGPYTGVADGRILKWLGSTLGWIEFAVTAQNRSREICDGSSDPNLELICGRPLGLMFNQVTCELYIADASFGLMKVGRKGGVAKLLASSAEGVPFMFTNSLDINQDNGIVYFTDTSNTYNRRNYSEVFATGDQTGRFMKYDPRRKKVIVLRRGLKFANGVAISEDNSYVLIAESSNFHVLRYWIRGPRANTTEVFSQLPGFPDNIRKNANGQYWVALNNGGGTPSTEESIGVRLDQQGNILNTLYGDGLMKSVSEIEENKGSLFIGSISMTYMSVLQMPDTTNNFLVQTQ